VHLLTQLAAEHGMSEEDALAGSGLSAAQVRDPAAEATARQEFAVMRNVVRHCGDRPGLGVEAGTRYHITMYGVWGLALISSPTLRATVDVALRHLDLAFAFTKVSFVEADGEARLDVDGTQIPADVRIFLVERVMAGIQTIGRDIVSIGIPLRRVTFRHPRPADTSRHRAVFGVEPQFGADADSIAFDARLLDLPLPQANEWALRAYEQLCQELVASRRARTGLAGSVRHELARQPGRIPDQAVVAAGLNMSARTLFRRLAEEGTSFRALVEEVRATLADELLCTAGMTTDQVAQRLGYADPASFIRAFKRWNGVTPQAYRARSAHRAVAAPRS
jgi:AraC-like DNA-binding protein